MQGLLVPACALLSTLLVLAPSAAATVPGKLLAAYAGEYSARCKDPSAVRLRISSQGLTLARGTKSITGKFEMEALSYLGNNPPAGYRTTLMSQAKGAGPIVFILYDSANGPLVELDADPPVLRRVGLSRLEPGKYSKC